MHLYSTVLSPILHFTLHPIFQLIAILWLSLPRFQGATFVYERLVVPWVKKYEVQVDDAIDEAHRGFKRWLWSKIGCTVALVVGEGSNLLESLLELIFGKPSAEKSTLETIKTTSKKPAVAGTQQFKSSASLTIEQKERPQQPRHSVKDALRQSSTLEEFVVAGGDDNVERTEFMDVYVNDFKVLLQHGLYVFASMGAIKDVTNDASYENDGKFRLVVFSYTEYNNGGAFLISPVGEDNLAVVSLPIDGLSVPVCTGSQGIILEWEEFRHDLDTMRGQSIETITAEIVLSNEDDRDILFNCLVKCLPWMKEH